MKVLLAKQWHARWHDQKTARRWENNIKKVMTLGCQSCGYSSYTHYTHKHAAEMKKPGKDPNPAHFFLGNKNISELDQIFLESWRYNSCKKFHEMKQCKEVRFDFCLNMNKRTAKKSGICEYWEENKTSLSQLYAMKEKGKKGVSTKKAIKINTYYLSIVQEDHKRDNRTCLKGSILLHSCLVFLVNGVS